MQQQNRKFYHAALLSVLLGTAGAAVAEQEAVPAEEEVDRFSLGYHCQTVESQGQLALCFSWMAMHVNSTESLLEAAIEQQVVRQEIVDNVHASEQSCQDFLSLAKIVGNEVRELAKRYDEIENIPATSAQKKDLGQIFATLSGCYGVLADKIDQGNNRAAGFTAYYHKHLAEEAAEVAKGFIPAP